MAIIPLKGSPLRMRTPNQPSIDEEQECYRHSLKFAQLFQCNDRIRLQFLITDGSKVGYYFKDVDSGSIVYENHTDSNVAYNGGYARMNILISDKVGDCEDGCYQLCIFDYESADVQEVINGNVFGDELVVNGGFDQDDPWIYDSCDRPSQRVGSVGKLEIAFSDGSNKQCCLEQLISLEDGSDYKLTYDITAFSETGNMIKKVCMDDDENICQNISGTGASAFYFTANSNSDRVRFIAATPNPVIATWEVQYEVDNVSLKKSLTVVEVFEDGFLSPDLCSETLSVKEEWPCTLLFKYSCNEDEFGFNYGGFSDKVHWLRVRGWIDQPSYIKDKVTHKDRAADKMILYASSQKVLQMFVDHNPPYIHEAIGLALKHDTCQITYRDRSTTGVNYLQDGGYSPEYEENMLMGTAQVGIKPLTGQNLQNNY